MGAAPLRAREALGGVLDEWASDGPEAWERWLPRIAEIADGIGAIIGAPGRLGFPRPERFGDAGGACDLLRLHAAQRNEVVYEALQFPSLTYVWREWERFGRQPRIVPSDDGRTIPTERIVAAITEKTAIAVLSHAYYVSGAIADMRAIQEHCRTSARCCASTPIKRPASIPYDVTRVGSRHRHRRIAQMAVRRPGLRLDLRQAGALDVFARP